MIEKEVPEEHVSWRARVEALNNVPGLLRLVWRSAPKVVSAGIALRVLSALVPVGILGVAKVIIDAVVGTLKASHVPTAIWPWLLAEFLLAAMSVVLAKGIDYTDLRLADEFTREISLKVIDKASTLDLEYFEDATFHDKLERARVQCTDRISMLQATGLLFQQCVMLVSLSVGILYFQPLLFITLVLCALPVLVGESHYALAGYSLAHKLTPIRRELDYLRTLGCSRESAKEVKSFNLATHLRNQFHTLSDKVVSNNRQLARSRLRWGALLAIIGSFGYYGSYSYLVWLALHGQISVGTLTFLAGAIAAANGHLQTIFSAFSSISEQALFLTDLMVFLSLEPRIRSKPNAIPAPRKIQSGLEFRDVSFSYPTSHRPVLEHLNFRIDAGERVALVGANGQGKTTFVKLISRLYEPTSGCILLDGIDLREYSVDDLRSRIGIIFQDFFRYDMPIRHNLAVGRMELLTKDTALWDAAERSGADRLISSFPFRMDQMLGRRFEGGVDLSGGEWQKLALARAYLRDSQLLILDEPTASLDALAEADVFAKFAELTADRTAILISHRFSTVRMVDRIVVLNRGRIDEDGTHETLLARGGRYARMFETQAANYR